MSIISRTALLARTAASARSLSTSRAVNELKKMDFPAMSPTMTEGGIAGWKKQQGETFAAGDVLLEIETDKATIDVEAQDDGILAKIMLGDGAKNIAVGAPIAVLAEEGDDLSGADAVANEATSASGGEDKPAESPAPEAEPKADLATEAKDTHVQSALPLFPSVSRLLIDNGISDSSAIKGTGRHGMLTRGDVLAHLGKIDNPRGTMKSVADKQAKEAAEFKPFEGLQKGAEQAPKKDDKPLDYVSIRSIITSGLSNKVASNEKKKAAAVAAPKQKTLTFDDIIEPYLTKPSKSAAATDAPTPASKPSSKADYLEGLY